MWFFTGVYMWGYWTWGGVYNRIAVVDRFVSDREKLIEEIIDFGNLKCYRGVI